MRSPEQEMPCFGDFDRTNFACSYSCSYKTKCEEQTVTQDSSSRVSIDPDLNAIEIEPTEPTEQKGKTRDVHVFRMGFHSVVETIKGKEIAPAPAESKEEAPKSRFDVIDISEEEKK